MAIRFSNNAQTTLASGITAAATAITVADGSVFPALTPGDHTYVTLEDTSGNLEIVKVTAISSNTLTVTRGQDGTTAQAFSSGDFVQLRVTAALLNDLSDEASVTLWADIQNKPDPLITLSGDASGSATLTDLGSATLTATTADDSPNHVISNVDGLQAALDAKQNSSTALTTSTTFGGDVSGTYNAIVVANDSHTHDTRYYTESEIGTFFAGTAAITGYNKSNWDTAYSWGNHASAGYLTGNQTITLTGDVSGSGTTSISVTIADDSHNHVISNVDGLQAALDGKLSTSGKAADSNLLDGIDSSQFLRSDANDTASGQYTFTKTDDHAIRVGAIRGTAVGDQPGEFIQLYERVHIGSPNGWGNGATTGAPSYGLSVYGGANLATHTGTVTIAGNTAWHAGNDGSGSGLDADLLDGYQLDGATSVATRIFNNKGQTHSTYTNFNTVMTPGPNYLQGGTNGPTGVASQQFYGFMFGLGSDYGTSTGTSGHYASQMYYPRNAQNSSPYLYFRDMESGAWGSWRKVYAGYADSAGNAGTLDGIDSSQFLRSDADDAFTGNLTTGANNHITFGPNGTWGSYLRVGGNGRTATGTEMASVVTTDGNLHLDAANSNNAIYLNFYAGTDGTAFGTGATGISAWMSSGGQLYKSTAINSTSNPYWHAANDGSGSGLDADTLDGNQSSFFADKTNQQTFNAPLNINGGTAQGTYDATLYVTATNNNDWGLIVNKYNQSSNEYGIDLRVGSSATYAFRVLGNGGEKFRINGTGQAFYQGSSYWHALNDGSGSGLDADLLDGIDSTYFNRGDNAFGTMVGTSGWNLNDVFTNRNRSGFFDAWSGSNFPPGTTHVQGLQTRHNTSTHYGWQLAGQYNQTGILYTRGVSNSSFGAWSKIWTDATDGSGSGLDADLLDGLQPSQLSVSSATASDYINSVNYATDYSSNLIYWQASALGTDYAPDGSWYNTIRGSHGGGVSYYSNTLAMKMTGSYVGDIYTQTRVNGTLQGWNRFWHSNNDGSGSGLDADLLDGYDSGSYLNRAGTTYYQAGNWIDFQSSNGAGLYWSANTGAGWHIHPTTTGNMRLRSGQSTYCQIELNTAGTPRGHVYADNGNNVGLLDYAGAWLLRGSRNNSWQRYYADGATFATIWDSLNDGSGSGLDADLLDGSQGSYFDHRAYTSTGNYLGGHYVSGGGEKPNSSALGAGKLKPIMLSGSNVGVSGSWNDVLWMSTYTGGDVKRSTAIISSKYDATSVWVNKANYDSSSWGTSYLFWNSGNDGSGSGLDADLLDGLNSNQFIRSDTQATTSAPLTIGVDWGQGNYNSAFVIQGTYPSWETRGTSTQNFGWLHHQDGSGNYTLYSIASYNQNNWTQRYIFYTNGNFTATGNVTAYSDISKKKDIRPLEDASGYLAALDAKRYRWKEDDREDIGFIAQDVEAVGLDAFVIENETHNPKTGEQIESVKSLDYGRMVSVLWQAVKELKAEVDDLKAQLKEK